MKKNSVSFSKDESKSARIYVSPIPRINWAKISYLSSLLAQHYLKEQLIQQEIA